MRRREFITLLGSAAAAWPLAAGAQQPKRRIGVLMSRVENDPEGQARVRAFLDGLQQLGWADGRNVRIDIRWTAGNPADTDKYAAELVALALTSFLPLPAGMWRRCSGLPAACRSCLRMSSTRLVPDSLRAWRGRVATPRDLAPLNTASAENGSNFSKRLRPT